MNYILPCLIPFIFLFSFLYAYRKKVNVYESFCEGVKGAIPLVVSIFPYLVAINMLIKLLEVSGLQTQIEQVLSPVFSFLGIPKEFVPVLNDLSAFPVNYMLNKFWSFRKTARN